MGGLVTLSLLADDAGRGLVDGVVLCAPMTSLKHARIIRAMLLLAPPHSRRATQFAPGAGSFASHRRPFAINRVTHDARRYSFTERWFAAEPRLRLGGPTYGWLRAGLQQVKRVMRRDFLARIDTPCLVLSAELDQLIAPASHEQLAQLCASCDLRRYADARHEIMMEIDPIRARFWSDFDSFAAPLLGRRG
jgi:lysophospholipase